jgi:DNA-binding MarR family transcriptional regulator
MKKTVVREFRRILRIFERELNIQNQSGCCCGVTVTQCHTLLELDKKDNVTLNELATRLNLDKSTVSRTVDSLVKNELIDRTIPKSNRRTTCLALTSKGKERCQTINTGNDLYFSQVLSALPENIREPFLIGFETLANSMTLLNKPTRS